MLSLTFVCLIDVVKHNRSAKWHNESTVIERQLRLFVIEIFTFEKFFSETFYSTANEKLINNIVSAGKKKALKSFHHNRNKKKERCCTIEKNIYMCATDYLFSLSFRNSL